VISDSIEARIKTMYDAVDDDIKENLVDAAIWARKTLTDHEGKGHILEITDASSRGFVVCSFMKPEWAGDHCGQPMETGSQAIVRAVCEYMCGA
jgi:hypothetical protein